MATEPFGTGLRIDALTIFPEMIQSAVRHGIVGRAVEAGLVSIEAHDLRQWSQNKHRTLDDAPFGGGPGMVMRAEPFFLGVEAVMPEGGAESRPIVLLSPRGRPFDRAMAHRYAACERLVFLCGRYEGVDERVATNLATEEVSLGDFVLTGGEVAALAIIEASVRLVPGALGDAGSSVQDSFEDGLLDYPHYTRPAVFRGLSVPEVLLSGDHGRIAAYRKAVAIETTRARRPDLIKKNS